MIRTQPRDRAGLNLPSPASPLQARSFGAGMIPATCAPSSQTQQSLAGRTVLQILPRLDAGGAERTTLDVAAALVHAGGRALVACDGGRLVSELQALGGVWLPFPAAPKIR